MQIIPLRPFGARGCRAGGCPEERNCGAERKDYLRKYREEWREDASNDDTTIERNMVRPEAILFREKTLDPNLVEHLGRICKLLSEA